MTTATDPTVRERVLAASTSFAAIDSVVLSTFGFGTDFLEEHALPAVLGLDGTATPARRQAVHESLAGTPVTVTFDATTESAPSGLYRYLAVPVPLVGRLFHPKIIAIAGRTANDERRVWLGVGSANLTMSGWGRNAESFGSVWLEFRSQQPVSVLEQFAAWLTDTTGLDATDQSSALVQLSDTLRRLPQVSDAEVEADPARFYVSSVYTKGLAAFVGELAAGSRMRVLSPYWSDVRASVTSFGAASTQLIPALRQDGRGVGLLREQARDLPDTVEIARSQDDDGRRFWHAKAYEFHQPNADGGVDVLTAVGSCNFSGPGLRGGNGNVEAMLVRDCTLAGLPGRDSLTEMDVSQLPELPPEDDAAPTPLPVGIVVFWDWAEQHYRWLINDGDDGCRYELELPSAPTVVVTSGAGTHEAAAPDRGAQFVLRWGHGHAQRGVVVEVNLHLSPRTYGRRLRAAEILDSWRGRSVYVGGDGDLDELGEGPGGAPEEAEDGDDMPFDAFDLYEFYRSLRQLEASVADQAGRPAVQRAMLVTRPDSVWSLAQLTAASEATPELRFLVLTELAATAQRHASALDAETLRRLAELSSAARVSMLDRLVAEVGDREQAEQMVAWFEARSAAMGAAL